MPVKIPLMVTAAVAVALTPMYGSFGLFDPWETHYAEVARNMRQAGDWISPWWGSAWPSEGPCRVDADCPSTNVCEASRSDYLDRPGTCRPAHIAREGRYFFSKPALSFWMMALGMGAVGPGPWGIRLPFLLAALLGVFELSRAACRLWGPRAGALAGVVMGASPMVALMSRQALTDGPFVALLTAGCARLMTGLWDDDPERDEPAPRAFAALALGVAGWATAQALLIGLQLRVVVPVGPGVALPLGPLQALVWTALTAAFLRSAWRSGPTARKVDLWVGHALLGLALLGKGVLAIALPAVAFMAHLVVTRERGLAGRLELPRGVAVASAMALPWYVAMLTRHHPEFWQRFFVHDHIKRLTSGVHAVDGGGFEHYVLWLGLAMFPWSALLPAAALAQAVSTPEGCERSGPRQARLFCGLWALTALAVFSLARTKFHHYILPAVPPAAVLIALLLDDLAGDHWPRRTKALVTLSGLGGVTVLGADLVAHPRRIINLVSYLYDRAWPHASALQGELGLWAVAAGAAMLPGILRRPKATPVALSAVALAFAAWCTTRYLPAASATWSQQGIFDTYYKECGEVVGMRCERPIVSYRMFWRGETWHSGNTVIPLRDDAHVQHFLTGPVGRGAFYAVLERRRLTTQFHAELSPRRREGVRVIHDSNAKFVLVHVPAAAPSTPPHKGPPSGHEPAKPRRSRSQSPGPG